MPKIVKLSEIVSRSYLEREDGNRFVIEIHRTEVGGGGIFTQRYHAVAFWRMPSLGSFISSGAPAPDLTLRPIDYELPEFSVGHDSSRDVIEQKAFGAIATFEVPMEPKAKQDRPG